MRRFILILFLLIVPIGLLASVIVDTSGIEAHVLEFIGDFLNGRASSLGITLIWEFFPYSTEPKVVIHNLPIVPFSPSESEWLRDWVFSGGTLVLGGEHRIFRESDEIINDLLGSGGFGLVDSIVPTWVVDTSRWVDSRDYWYTVDPNPRDNLVFASDSFIVFAGAYLVLGSTAKPLLVLGDSAHSDYGRVGKQPNASQIHYGDGQILLFADENVLFVDTTSIPDSIYSAYCNRDLLNRILLIGTDNIEEDYQRPSCFALHAHPNPFNSAVTISIDGVGDGSPVPFNVEIYDVAGRLVDVIDSDRSVISSEDFQPDEKSPTNAQEISRQARNDNINQFFWRPAASLPSGVYLVRARFDTRSLSGVETTATKRVVYLK